MFLNKKELFFDLNNISFSHLKCNVGAARRIYSKHGTRQSYKKGCRCDECKYAVKIETREIRRKRKEKTGKDR